MIKAKINSVNPLSNKDFFVNSDIDLRFRFFNDIRLI